MTDYSKQLTHEHRNRYQTLDILNEWDRTLYKEYHDTRNASFFSSPATLVPFQGIYDETRHIQPLLAWVDTLRKQPSESFLDESALTPLILETRPHLDSLSNKALSYWVNYPDYIKPIPMLRVLSEVYNHNLLYKDFKTERIIDFLKTLHAALNEPSFKKELDHHQRAQRKALKKHIDAVKTDFQQYPCLLFVHLLLVRDPLAQSQNHLHSENNQQFVQWKEALVAECCKGRQPVFADLVRYYWRIIGDSSFGLRLWMIFAFVPTAKTLSSPSAVTPEQRANQIGQVWRETITQQGGIALTMRVKDHPAKPSSQLGVVCREDQAAIARLQRLMYTLEALNCLGNIQEHPKPNNKVQAIGALRSQGNGAGPAAPISSKPKSKSRSTV